MCYLAFHKPKQMNRSEPSSSSMSSENVSLLIFSETALVDMWNRSILNETSSNTYNWGVLMLIPIVLFGLTGNVLVCLSVSLEKRLQTVTNYFLLSLAITDLHVCFIVMPISIINELFGYWPFNNILCNVFITCDVLMCTSSILHLCGISLQRYLAIRYPLKTRNKSKSIVLLKISLIWAAAAAISSPVTILGIVNESNVLNDRRCWVKNNTFLIYGSILAFFIPLVIMVVAYALTVRLLDRQSQLCDPNRACANSGQTVIRRSKTRRRQHGSSSFSKQSLSSGSSSRENNFYELQKKETYSLETKFSKSADNILKIPAVSVFSDSASCESFLITTFVEHKTEDNRFLSVPAVRGLCSAEFLISDNDMSTTDEDSRNEGKPSNTEISSRSAMRNGVMKQFMTKASSKSSLTRERHNDTTSVRTEQKASKVLGFVFALFVISWTPFFVVNILQAICQTCFFNQVLFSTFVWLGWISSTLNPIIYTMFNLTFKQTFIKLLKCHYSLIKRSKSRLKQPTCVVFSNM